MIQPNQTDVLSYMLPSPSFMASLHLESTQPGVNPIYTFHDPGKGLIWYMKGKTGNPWDVMAYDEKFVCQYITEVATSAERWADPKSFKKCISKNWPRGIAWSKRYLDIDKPEEPIITTDSTWELHEGDCAKVTKTFNTGQVQTLVQGFFGIDFGGDIHEASTLVLQYQWSNGAVMETFFYALGYGHVQWQTASLKNGVYVVDKTTLQNKIVDGGSPTPNFGCAL